MHSEIDEPEIPRGIAVFGTDDASGGCSMLYFDERGVSRRHETLVDGNEWKWWRNAPEFSQRFIGRIAPDGVRVVPTGGGMGRRAGEDVPGERVAL